MTARRLPWIAPLVGSVLALVLSVPPSAGAFDVFRYDEATIADIHAAFKAKTLTCRALVQMYLDRIEAYDRKGPALNAIVVTNPDALKVADGLDTRFAQSGPVGPLHCVPLIVKDNYAARRRAPAVHPAEHRSRRHEARRSWIPSPSPRSTASRPRCCSASGSRTTSTSTCPGWRPTRK